MAEVDHLSYHVSLQDFKQARRRAALQQVLARLTGKSTELLAYEDVRKKLRGTNTIPRGLQEIPVDAIVGSVGRYQDFTRTFLPRQQSHEQRWARVKAVATTMGLPPIEVYQVGDAYFVIDGHHRVSVARQLGTPTISAYVTEVRTRVSLSASDDPAELICKARYVEFLERTNLDKLRPEADLLMTFCGQYRVLLYHIDVHRYYMGLDQQRHDIPYDDAVAHWYDDVYMPVVQLIREQGLLHDFPELTAADLYVLLAEHRAELEQALGWGVDTETVAADLVEQKGRSSPTRLMARLGDKLRDVVVPAELEPGPPPGRWREERLSRRRDERLFADVLVAVNGTESGWRALAQALLIARRENSRVLGLHVLPPDEQPEEATIAAIQAEFERHCQEAGVRGEFAARPGVVVATLIERAALVDLLAVPLTYPPGVQPLARLGSNFVSLIQRSPRPVLAVPGGQSPLDRLLLASDGSPKADEALFVATYLAARWQTSLCVAIAGTEAATATAVARARSYLEEQGVLADFVVQPGPAAPVILETAAEKGSNLLIMGGFSFRPMLELVLGGTVDEMLREFKQPMLICR